MKASTEILVRFADCDLLGHTNNASYFTFMEQARLALFGEYLWNADEAFEPLNFPFIIGEVSCRFLKPSYFNQTLVIELQVTEVKNSSFAIEYVMKDKKTMEPVALAKSIQICFDYKTGKSQPIPEEYRKAFSK